MSATDTRFPAAPNDGSENEKVKGRSLDAVFWDGDNHEEKLNGMGSASS